MVIQVDTREKPKAIKNIIKEFDSYGAEHFSKKLDVGDYQVVGHPEFVIDRKQNLLEVASNFTEDRFIREMKRAKENGIKIVFLVEHGYGIERIEDVQTWKNPRLKDSPMALSGERIYRKMLAYEHTYGVEFAFCEKKMTGMTIIGLLGNNTGEW